MAIQDATLFFHEAQAIAGAANYQDVIDLGAVAGLTGWGAAAIESLGGGQNIYWNTVVTTIIGAAIATIELCTDGALGAPGGDLAAFNILATITLPVGTPVGTRIAITVPSMMTERYVQVIQTTGGNTGGITSWLSSAPMDSDINQKA